MSNTSDKNIPLSGTLQASTFRYAKNILWHASRFALPFFILYLTASLTLKIIQHGGAWERLPYVIGATLLALACIYLFIRFNVKNKSSASPFAYWGMLFVGVMSEFLVPSEVGNRQATILAVIIASASTGFLIALLRYWALMVIVPFLLFLVFNTYLRIALNMEIDAALMAEILGASPQDAAQFTTTTNILGSVLIILIVTGITTCVTKWACSERRLLLGGANCLLLAAAILVSLAVDFRTMSYSMNQGIGNINASIRFYRAFSLAKVINGKLIKKASQLTSPSTVPSNITTLKGDEEMVVVLHIGESVRADRLSLNGYERDTTPWLKTCENLINFPDCTAVSPSTGPSTLAILTNARGNMEKDISPELEATTGCVMDLFAVNGFDCCGFFNSATLDKQEMWGAAFERLVAIYTAKAKKVYELGPQSEYKPKAQLPQINEALKDGSKNKFFLINNLGSHIPFMSYDQSMATFLPADGNAIQDSPQSNPEAAQKILNAYDNTLVYTDEYIRDLIHLLKGKPFIYIYISDHGEVQGENNKWIRANLAQEFHMEKWSKVPFFIIYSHEFEQLHPHFKEALVNLHNNCKMPTAHENIFHTLLGIFDIQTPYYESERDLSSPSPSPYQGPSCDRNGETLDGLKWK